MYPEEQFPQLFKLLPNTRKIKQYRNITSFENANYYNMDLQYTLSSEEVAKVAVKTAKQEANSEQRSPLEQQATVIEWDILGLEGKGGKLNGERCAASSTIIVRKLCRVRWA